MKSDFYLSFVILFQMIETSVQLLMPMLGVISVDTAAKLRVVITLLTYIPGAIIIMRRRLMPVVFSFLVYFIILLLSFDLFPASRRFIESSQTLTLTPIAILTTLFVININDFGTFKKGLLLVARFSVVISLLFTFAHIISPYKILDKGYSMSFGFSMLLPAMFLYTQKSYFDKIASFLLFALILLNGSRSPVIVLVIFYAYTFLVSPVESKKNVVFVVVLVAVAVFLIQPQMDLFQNSRTMRLFLQGELLSHDSGREEDLYSVVRPLISEGSIFGWGIGSDRHFLNGNYCHNIFLEIFLHYGIFIGTLLFAVFFIYCLKSFFSPDLRRMPNERIMFMMLFLYGFVPKLVSGSYLIDFAFAIFLGYLLSIKKHTHSQISNTLLSL